MSKNEVFDNHVNKTPSSNIMQIENGFTWIYEFSLWKNPTVFITVAKILVLSSFVVGLFLFVITALDDIGEAFSVATNVFFFTLGAMTGLLLIAYPIYSMIYGGKYVVVFEMNDEGIIHRHIQKQYKKSQVMSMLSAALGVATSNPTLTGAGIVSVSKNSQETIFSKVKKIVIHEKREVIYLTDSNGFNQIYAERDDFAFVREYIINRCSSNAKVVCK